MPLNGGRISRDHHHHHNIKNREHENCACGTNYCRIIGKCNKKPEQLAGKVGCQNWYFITPENYVTGNNKDFEKNITAVEEGENSKGPLVIRKQTG